MATYISIWELKFLDQVSAPLRRIVDVMGKSTQGLNGITKAMGQFGSTQMHLNHVASAAREFGDMLNSITEPGRKFEVSQKQLQAITNVNEKQLDKISQNARKLAKDFGVDATLGMNAFSQSLSELGPHIAQNDEALKSIGQSAFILSKQLGNDVPAAQSVLDQALMNFGNNIEDPIAAARQMAEMMNVMSKAAADGAVTLPGIEKVVRSASVSAKLAGVNFYDFQAAIQAAGEMNPDQLGTSLSRLFSGMQTAADKSSIQGDLKKLGVNMDILTSKSAPLYARISEIQKITKSKNSTSLLNTLFGEDGIKSAIYLVEDMEKLRQGAGGIRDSIVNHQNDAVRQANIVMGSYEERVARMNAKVSDFAITIFNASKSWLPFATGIAGVVVGLGQLPAAFEFLKSSKGLIVGMFTDSKTALSGSASTAKQGLVSLASAGGNTIKTLMRATQAGVMSAYQNTSAFITVFRGNPGAVMRGFFAPVLNGFSAVVARSRAAILWAGGFLNALRTNPTGLARSFFAPILTGFAALKTSIGGAIMKFYTFMTTLTLAQVKTALWNGIVAIATAVQWLWNAALSMNPIGLLIIGVSALALGMVALYKNSETVRNVFAKIGEVIGWVWEKIKSFFSYIFDQLGKLLKPVADFLGLSAPKIDMPTDVGNSFLGATNSLIPPPPSDSNNITENNSTYAKIGKSSDANVSGSGGTGRNIVINFSANSIQIMQGATLNSVQESADKMQDILREAIVSAIRDAEITA